MFLSDRCSLRDKVLARSKPFIKPHGFQPVGLELVCHETLLVLDTHHTHTHNTHASNTQTHADAHTHKHCHAPSSRNCEACNPKHNRQNLKIRIASQIGTRTVVKLWTTHSDTMGNSNSRVSDWCLLMLRQGGVMKVQNYQLMLKLLALVMMSLPKVPDLQDCFIFLGCIVGVDD